MKKYTESSEKSSEKLKNIYFLQAMTVHTKRPQDTLLSGSFVTHFR